MAQHTTPTARLYQKFMGPATPRSLGKGLGKWTDLPHASTMSSKNRSLEHARQGGTAKVTPLQQSVSTRGSSTKKLDSPTKRFVNLKSGFDYQTTKHAGFMNEASSTTLCQPRFDKQESWIRQPKRWMSQMRDVNQDS